MSTPHPFDLKIGQPGTVLVRCPDCGQLEVWTEEESFDHGLCRSAGCACWCQEDGEQEETSS